MPLGISSSQPIGGRNSSLSRQTSYAVAFPPLDYLRGFSQTRGPLKEFSEPTEEPDAHRITYRHRAQRRHRRVGSTERSAARGRARLLGLLKFVRSVRAKFETETGITGAGSPSAAKAGGQMASTNYPSDPNPTRVPRAYARVRAPSSHECVPL